MNGLLLTVHDNNISNKIPSRIRCQSTNIFGHYFQST